MTEANENPLTEDALNEDNSRNEPRKFRFVCYVAQKCVYGVLRITPRAVVKPISVFVGAVCGAVKYSARFFCNKLDSDVKFKAKLQRVFGDERVQKTSEHIRKSGVFKWLVAFFWTICRSAASGAKSGYLECAQYRERVEAERSANPNAERFEDKIKKFGVDARDHISRWVESKIDDFNDSEDR